MTAKRQTPTPNQARALVAAIVDHAESGRDYAYLIGVRLDMVKRMYAAGWVSTPDRKAYVTDEGRESVAPILQERAEVAQKAALIAELSADPEIKAEAIRLMKGGFRDPWVMARNNVESRRVKAAAVRQSTWPTVEEVGANEVGDGYQCADCGHYFDRNRIVDINGEYYCRDGMGHNTLGSPVGKAGG
ncbi:hypothetical protein [Micromonospora sp. CA-248212]|uniref:hypothetical protein n=1 Tax=Micromonospora sp. CA-248212 TaxID=3239961 RepID=UPI003D8A91C8